MSVMEMPLLATGISDAPTWLWLCVVGCAIGFGYLLGQRLSRRRNEEATERVEPGPRTSELDQVLTTQLAMRERYRRPFCLMLVACDGAGDAQADADWAERLIAKVRDSDIVCRLTERRFAIVVPSTDLFGGSQIGDRLCRDARSLGEDDADPQTASIGLAAGIDGDNVASLLARTEEALEVAVREGGDSVWRHTGEFVEQIECRPPADDPYAPGMATGF